MRALALAALLASLSAPASAIPLAATPLSRADLPWWRERHAAKLAEASRGADLVLLGDSITQQLELPEYAGVLAPLRDRYRVLDLGFNGDATSHLLWRVEHGELAGLHPSAVVILIGANNLGRLHWPTADDLAGIDAVVAATRARLPGTPILLIGVLPSDRGSWARAREAAIDAGLARRFAAGQVAGVTYYDPSPLFLTPDGRVDTAAYRDPPTSPALHPTPAGMARLFAAIQPTLAEWLGHRPR